MTPIEAIASRITPLLARQSQVIIAIDGSCTAGKTTLARQLAQRYDCNVFHMDDFFLRPEQRTAARFAEIGGNVDYTRFHEEVLLPLKSGQSFSYRPFSCSTSTLSDPVSVVPKPLTIIEGTYSHHPYFGDAYDLKVCMTLSAELQHRRVLERPAFLHRRFLEEWIPMENRYLEAFRIPENSHLVFHADQLHEG